MPVPDPTGAARPADPARPGRRAVLATGLGSFAALAAGPRLWSPLLPGEARAPAHDLGEPLRVFAVDQHDLELDALDAALGAATSGADGAVRTGGAVDVPPFVLIGITYQLDPAAHPRAARLRVRTEGRWGPWAELDGGAQEGPDDPDPALVAPPPVWVGVADGYEIELPAAARELAVHVVRERDEVIGRAEVPLQAAFARQPAIRRRAAWLAAPATSTSYAPRLQMAVVHHTVTANGYSASQVPAMLRSIQTYHMQSRGFWDVAYNFFVDRFGVIWEGRAGGIDRPVVGAHAANHNTGSTGIAMLGTFTSTAPTAAMLDAVSSLAAWKLAIEGIDAGARITYRGPSGSSKRLPAIIGHRDVVATACPGDQAYPRLGSIRQAAVRKQLVFPDVPRDAYFHEPVLWAVGHGITDGVGDSGQFMPHLDVTRAQVAAFLWRMMDRPEAARANFTDVPSASYFAPAVRWMAAERITTGVGGSNRFEPHRAVTRGELGAFLWRMVGSPAEPAAHGFPDVPSGAFFDVPVRWLRRHEITDGVGNTGRFEPHRPVSRAQVVAFLHRLAGAPAAWGSRPPPSTVRFGTPAA